jgi:hypothetical protein
MTHAAIRSPLTLVALSMALAAVRAAPPAPNPTAHPVPPLVAANVLTDACPTQLPVSQTVTGTIAGWTAQNQQGSYPFTRVAFYPGPPTENALIVPTVEYKAPAGLHDGWDLPPRAGGYWMTCAYGNTTATVSRKLADDVDFCQADYDMRFMTLVVRHWLCGNRRAMGLPPSPRPAAARPMVRPAPNPASRGAG